MPLHCFSKLVAAARSSSRRLHRCGDEFQKSVASPNVRSIRSPQENRSAGLFHMFFAFRGDLRNSSDTKQVAISAALHSNNTAEASDCNAFLDQHFLKTSTQVKGHGRPTGIMEIELGNVLLNARSHPSETYSDK